MEYNTTLGRWKEVISKKGTFSVPVDKTAKWSATNQFKHKLKEFWDFDNVDKYVELSTHTKYAHEFNVAMLALYLVHNDEMVNDPLNNVEDPREQLTERGICYYDLSPIRIHVALSMAEQITGNTYIKGN